MPTVMTQVLVGVTLMLLLGVSIVAAYTPLGPLKPLAGLIIAGFKAALIAAFFMHLRYRSRIVAIFAAAGLLWLAILLTLSLGDYLSRR